MGFHIWFFYIYYTNKACTCQFFITSHISHLSFLTLSRDIFSLALTWIFVLSGSWKWLQKAIFPDILWMSPLSPCGIQGSIGGANWRARHISKSVEDFFFIPMIMHIVYVFAHIYLIFVKNTPSVLLQEWFSLLKIYALQDRQIQREHMSHMSHVLFFFSVFH